MTQPTRYLTRMTLFVALVLAIVFALIEPLGAAFTANAPLNGLILGVLVIGAGFTFRQVLRLKPEIEWVKSFRKQKEGASESAPTPRLLAPMAALLSEERHGDVKLSALSTRSLLDSIASRLEEGREITRYFVGLLIFLGLLGTFWGLLETIRSIGDTINSLSVSGTDLTVMFDDLKSGLEAPLSGMGTAFSSSLFGLAGSVMLGFLDLQAGQALNRFYNDLEEWLSGLSRLGTASALAGDGDASAGAYTTALLEQSADSLDKLHRIIEKSEDSRKEVNKALISLAEEMASLNENTRESQKLLKAMAESQGDVSSAMHKAAKGFESSELSLDETSRGHLRNMDVHLTKLLEEQEKGREALTGELRNEFKILARTLSVLLDGRKKQQDSD